MNDESPNQIMRLQNLMRDAKAGNESAFEIIYKEYYTPLFRYIRSRVRNTADAEDITQTVFMRIWNGLPHWNENHTSPTAFFFHVARNIIIDTFRKKSHKEIISDEVVALYIETENQSSAIPLETDDETEKISSYIRELSEEQQEILSLRYTNGLSYKEIAEITNKREDAIRQTHSRAIKTTYTIQTNKMNDTEFENLIQSTLRQNEEPSRDSFARFIQTLPESTVTKNNDVRYTIRRVSNIINQTIDEFIMAWKTKNIILVPTFLLLIIVGAFSLSSRKPYDEVIMDLATENQTIEDEGIMDEELLVTDLNSPDVDELVTQQNDIF